MMERTIDSAQRKIVDIFFSRLRCPFLEWETQEYSSRSMFSICELLIKERDVCVLRGSKAGYT